MSADSSRMRICRGPGCGLKQNFQSEVRAMEIHVERRRGSAVEKRSTHLRLSVRSSKQCVAEPRRRGGMLRASRSWSWRHGWHGWRAVNV